MTEEKAGKRIVVGVDGSEPSIAALRKAAQLATALGGHVDAVGCWTVPKVSEGSRVFGGIDFAAGSRQLLEDSVRKAFGGDVPPNVSPRLINGYPRQALIEASENAHMLVLGRRGRGGFLGLALGSVTTACVAHAHCPVLVVHDSDAATQEGPEA